MSDATITPPTPRQALIARGEQAVLLALALVVVAGVAYRAISRFRLGAEPLEIVPAASPTYRVNVNTADWVMLALVPGLGETLSKRIVDERDRRGGRFKSLDDLVAVRGIGDKKLAGLRPYLFVAEGSGDKEEPVRMPDTREAGAKE